ncbi:MAG: AAA family ATPase [Acidimicrobiales bacterium]
MTAVQFPFSAVVGADEAKLALILNAVDPAVGGLLLRGQKGSAKTTLARGLAALLGAGAPFIELPVGATEDRLVGSIDLAAALTGGEQRFASGLLAAAHGGVLYVDEVNLLPDHLVDVLLDVAASGINRVEREGISHTHPSRFLLVGSMNPEEGELRPQLLDRFGLCVDVAASLDAGVRAEAVRRRLAFDADPQGFAAQWAEDERLLVDRLANARNGPSGTGALDANLTLGVSRLCASVGAEGLRADIVICRAVSALAAWEGDTAPTAVHVRRVAPLALAHRRRRSPFEDHGIDGDELDHALDDALGPDDPPQNPDPDPDSSAVGRPNGPRPGDANDRSPSESVESDDSRSPDNPGAAAPHHPGAGAPHPSEPVAPRPGRPVIRLEASRLRDGASPSGRRTPSEGARGRLVADRAPDGRDFPLALGATVRTAARRRAGEVETYAVEPVAVEPDADSQTAPLVRAEDLRQAVRRQRVANLVILVVDASGSMGVENRMEAAKGAVVNLLVDAYQRRDRVALVTFSGDDAEVVLRPTGSVEVAKARLGPIPTGGRTPLAAGILAGLDLAQVASSGAHQPLMVLVSDGRATMAPAGQDPWAAALVAAEKVKRQGLASVVVDVEEGPGMTRLGLARKLSVAMGARHLTLDELSGPALARAIADHAER